MKKVIMGLLGKLEIELKNVEDVTLIILKGQLDALSSEEVSNILNYLIKKGSLKAVVELDELEYMDSSGLAMLIRANNSFKTKGGSLKIAGLSGKAKSVFELARVVELFELFDTEKKALDSFKA